MGPLVFVFRLIVCSLRTVHWNGIFHGVSWCCSSFEATRLTNDSSEEGIAAAPRKKHSNFPTNKA
jgi:hypothetical protein